MIRRTRIDNDVASYLSSDQFNLYLGKDGRWSIADDGGWFRGTYPDPNAAKRSAISQIQTGDH